MFRDWPSYIFFRDAPHLFCGMFCKHCRYFKNLNCKEFRYKFLLIQHIKVTKKYVFQFFVTFLLNKSRLGRQLMKYHLLKVSGYITNAKEYNRKRLSMWIVCFHWLWIAPLYLFIIYQTTITKRNQSLFRSLKQLFFRNLKIKWKICGTI